MGYPIFSPVAHQADNGKACQSFIDLMHHIQTISKVFLKDTLYCYSHTSTIADLSIAPCLSLMKVRPEFWDAVPNKVKEYHERVLEVFPEMEGYVEFLEDVAVGYDRKGWDLEPICKMDGGVSLESQ